MRGNEVLLLDYIRRVSMPLTKSMSGILRCDVMIMHNNNTCDVRTHMHQDVCNTVLKKIADEGGEWG